MTALDALIAAAEQIRADEWDKFKLLCTPPVVIALCKVAQAARYWRDVELLDGQPEADQFLCAALRDLDAVLGEKS